MRTLLPFTAMLAASALAQDAPPMSIGPYDTSGEVSVGYRFTDITGREEKFQELFNLRDGLRLLDFSFIGNAKPGTAPFADRFQVSASGLGGDPFPTLQGSVSKTQAYDLRASYRQSYYYWDRNDDAPHPAGINGLTTNHNWATVRRLGSVNLLIHATNRLKLRFDYNYNSRDGMTNTTRVMQYFGSQSSWGSFMRENPYYLYAPAREDAHRISGGFDYTIDKWSFHYALGYQSFDMSQNWTNVTSPQRSINTSAAPTANELLQSGSWSETRSLKTPFSEFVYNGAVNSWLSLRGDFFYYRYRGPASMNAGYAGSARTSSSGSPVAPYAISVDSRGQLSQNNYIADQGFTFKLASWTNLHIDYRYDRSSQIADADFRSLYNSTTPFTDALTTEWRQGLHQLDTNLEIHPTASLVIRPGVRLMKRDVTVEENGLADPLRSKRIKTVWPIGSFAYLPSKKFSLRGDFQSITNGYSYTRITPHSDLSTRAVMRYRPLDRLTIEDNFVWRNRKLTDSDFRNNIRSNAATVSWAWSDKFSTYAGFSYDSYLATTSVTFVRGTAPLNATWRDQTINRVWQAGVSAQPFAGFGFSLTGNFVRTTGMGEISGEPPTFGPLTFPYGTGSVYYDFPKFGRLGADLQRTYYREEIVPGNNFQANLLTIRWTRGF
jgi:hypothetical protein